MRHFCLFFICIPGLLIWVFCYSICTDSDSETAVKKPQVSSVQQDEENSEDTVGEVAEKDQQSQLSCE